jgi:putative FmdB family regulatory protein
MTYEYTCSCCAHSWEQEQKISDKPMTHCPKCNGACARRLISSGNFQLKGTGWYKDGYK